jgi:hypothetical protein
MPVYQLSGREIKAGISLLPKIFAERIFVWNNLYRAINETVLKFYPNVPDKNVTTV